MKQITFIDEARIKVKGGNGGDGAKIFHTEKFVRQGGPSGGNGGDGGNIILKASYNENTLLDFRGRSQYIGHPGIRGGRQNLTGARGKNKVILVPVGTKVFDNKIQVADLGAEGMIFVAGTGGKGGRGNQSFKSSTNTAPSMYEQGEVTEFEEYQLELTVLADVGLLGFPNAGKSTFLSVVSNAKPKIASYEFTTLVPQLGVVKHKGQKYVVTDLPGLIEGAAENKGMGHQFLKHLSRTKVVLHLVDATQSDVMFRYNTLRKELANFDTNMAKLPEIIALNKVDELDEEQITELKAMFNDKKVFFISALTGAGVELLHDEVIEQIQV
ncbi:MAG: GTPase ObgE [Tenericutes bacterium]|nr:MAG: GTPase ObgE [Mycoplasmatota bacterium]